MSTSEKSKLPKRAKMAPKSKSRSTGHRKLTATAMALPSRAGTQSTSRTTERIASKKGKSSDVAKAEYGTKQTVKSRRKRAPQRRKEGTYNFEYVAKRAPWAVPVWWVNTIFAIFLLVPLGIWSQTFFTSFRDEAIHRGFWATEEFWFFGIGVVMWLIVFFSLPRPILIYVFGHEATHAIWAIAMGGRVSEFKVASDGGYIVTDTNNFWIALAPYFFPIYSLAIIAIYSGLSLIFDVGPYVRWFYAGIGLTWAFHVCFTLWMIPKGQTDLTYHGTFFSLVVISIMNLVVLTLFLIAASPSITWVSFGSELLQNTMDFCEWVASVCRQTGLRL